MVKTKNTTLTIRISEEDKRKIIQAAKKQRVTMSVFVEYAALNKAARVNRKEDE